MEWHDSEAQARVKASRMRRLLWAAIVLIVLGLAMPRSASVSNYYVDQSCAQDGNGLADQCASTAGGPGAFRSPQSCFSVVRASDTCFIKNGTYLTNNRGTSPRFDGGFRVDHSGTAIAPITIRNYPGHRPVLANCDPLSTRYCTHPTITAPERSYIIFDGLVVHGGFSLFGEFDVPIAGIILRNNEVIRGWDSVDDGNWAGIRLENVVGALVQNNYIHDISVLEGGGQQSSGTCIKLYQNTDAIVEYNTCKGVYIPESQAGGVDDKAKATRNIHRYNWIEDVPVCFRINNQLPSAGVRIYENICIAGRRPGYPNSHGIRLLTEISGIEVYNNVIYNFRTGFSIAGAGVQAARFYNNIIVGASDNNVETYFPPILSDYNSYTGGPRYHVIGLSYPALSFYQLATRLDRNSAERACEFVNPPVDFRLSATSACRKAGRVGGVSTGASIDQGAYITSTCIGYGCRGERDSKPPAGPGDAHRSQ